MWQFDRTACLSFFLFVLLSFYAVKKIETLKKEKLFKGLFLKYYFFKYVENCYKELRDHGLAKNATPNAHNSTNASGRKHRGAFGSGTELH